MSDIFEQDINKDSEDLEAPEDDNLDDVDNEEYISTKSI